MPLLNGFITQKGFTIGRSCLSVVLLTIFGSHLIDGLSLRRYAFHCRCLSGRTYRNANIVRYVAPSDGTKSHYDDLRQDNNNDVGTTVTVSYQGQSCDIKVLPNESILSALERQSLYVQSQLSALPEMPSDCRRGNCMTCAGRLIMNDKSSTSCSSSSSSGEYDGSVIRTTNDNGLSPTISKMIADQGYLLTCSSFVIPPQSDGTATTTTNSSSSVLQIELGVQNEIWNEVYDNRFTCPDTQLIARAAMARVLRQSAERNPNEWIQSTERILRQTDIE